MCNETLYSSFYADPYGLCEPCSLPSVDYWPGGHQCRGYWRTLPALPHRKESPSREYHRRLYEARYGLPRDPGSRARLPAPPRLLLAYGRHTTYTGVKIAKRRRPQTA